MVGDITAIFPHSFDGDESDAVGIVAGVTNEFGLAIYELRRHRIGHFHLQSSISYQGAPVNA